MIDFKALTAPLDLNEIDFRIQSINKGQYATILPYKDARVDINRLNSVCGQLGWERKHSRENHNCTVSLWDGENKQWVSKEDTGTESNTEAAKGLASDSFKRSCFNWGIGVELYDYPVISLRLNDDEVNMQGQRPKQTYNLKLKEWSWESEFDDGKVSFMSARDQNGKVRFLWGNSTKPNSDDISWINAIKENADNAKQINDPVYLTKIQLFIKEGY